MNGLARVLFQMDPLNPNGARGAIAEFHKHFAFAHDGVVKLADLVALRQVRIEVVFAVKGGHQVNLSVEAQPCAHGLFDAEFVDDGQHAGHCGVHEGHVCIGFGPKERRCP